MAELVLRFQYHEFADGLGLVGGHGLAVVGVAVAGQAPHLGRDFGIGDFKMQMGNAGSNGLQFGQVVQCPIGRA